jgi:hypothetical protein
VLGRYNIRMANIPAKKDVRLLRSVKDDLVSRSQAYTASFVNVARYEGDSKSKDSIRIVLLYDW